MTDYLSFAPYVAAVLVLAGAVGLFWSRRSGDQTKVDEPVCEIVSEWRPTGKIDFGHAHGRGHAEQDLFYLQTEEYRVLQSMSGTKHVEIRWRKGSLEEAKEVASRYNAKSVLLERELPSSVRSATLVPELPRQTNGQVQPLS